MPVNRRLLERLGFVQTSAAIILENGRLQYNVGAEEGLSVPGVYLIVQHLGENEEFAVLYVGKAGKGLNTRLGQHAAGYQRMFVNTPNYLGNSLQLRMAELQISRVQVWYRASEIKSIGDFFKDVLADPPFISLFSVEEEALIIYFKQLGEPLVNSSIPPTIAGSGGMESMNRTLSEVPSQCFDCLNKITAQIAQNSPDYLDDWERAIQAWDDQTKKNFCEALKQLSTSPLLQDRDAKIIGRYSGGPFAGATILVFGKMVNQRFAANTNQLMFTLDGEWLALNPSEPEFSRVCRVADFIEI